MIDLRSDMLGARTPAMLEAMRIAALKPPEMDERSDSEIRGLEEEVAAVLGSEDAIFLPTCTMANQIGLRLACASGSCVLADGQSHLATTERDATRELQRIELKRVQGERGHLSPALVAQSLATTPRPAVVWLENTHNLAGGTLMPRDWQPDIARLCRDAGAHLHLDGARIWNAVVARQLSPAALAAGANSVSVSFNKGLDAPVGAALAGPADFVKEAAVLRRRFGGQWRPAGMLAAAARVALRGYAPRISRTHRLASRLADLLAERLPAHRVDRPETNIIMLHLAAADSEENVTTTLRMHGVAALGFGGGRLRLVLHSAIADGSIGQIAGTVATVLNEMVSSK